MSNWDEGGGGQLTARAALQMIEDPEVDLDLEGEIDPKRRKLRKAIAESGYLRGQLRLDPVEDAMIRSVRVTGARWGGPQATLSSRDRRLPSWQRACT